jgi:hypothetical protein
VICRNLPVIAATSPKPIATTDFTNPMPTRVDLRLPDEVAEDVLRHKPRTMSLSRFCLFLIEIGVDREAKLPAYRVGAGYIDNLSTEQVESTPASQVTSELQAVESSAPEISSFQLTNFLGDGVGRESEGTPRKDPSLVVPQARKPVEKRHRTEYAPEFQAWWKLYQSSPSRASNQSKPRAYEEWKVAKGGHGAERLLSALDRNINDQKTKLKASEFCSPLPDAFRWIRDGRYEVWLEEHQQQKAGRTWSADLGCWIEND